MFLSYSHKDQALIDQLTAYVAALRRRGVIQVWTDQSIEAGTEWDKAIVSYLDSADIILLALSADFLASDYSSVEVREVLKRHNTGQAYVIPVMLRPVDWSDSPFSHLQSLPDNGKPITLWEDRDAAFLSVARSIQKVAEQLKAQAAVSDP
ncbi:TIR protein [Leptolyngbya sp. NIES-3755]|nr:TIR protein [Leptolyngbya sp. NIES-3755]